ncbi:MAG: cytochrome c [Planctomycetes bacterium]|nr:cytochrome c [Planctomycetota bacterium]MCB9904535.1 cytochrome c [Planctomycetota bacterium]
MNRVLAYPLTALAVVLSCAGLRALVAEDTEQRNYRFFPDMAVSGTHEAFDAAPGGTAMLPLVPGVVVRGELPLRFGPGPDEAQRAGRELHSPLREPTAADYEAGARLYGIYCSVCHDPAGNGRGRVVERGFLPPPSLHAARALAMADGEMFHILTHGQGNMASYAGQLSRDERWRVVLHVRRLQEESR